MRTAPTPAAVLIAVVAVLGPAAPAAAAQVTGSSPVHRPVLAPALAADGARTGGATDADLAEAIRAALGEKQDGHRFNDPDGAAALLSMMGIGG